MPVSYTKLPFDEAIAFFRGKLNLPTNTWTDIWQGAHSQAFVIAGATKESLLNDVRKAVDDAIANGTGIAAFREKFHETVAKNGWDFNGGFNWRTRVIYQTNVRQAYNAGREKQMQDPELRKLRPYGLYRHGDSAQPRQEHLAWDETVLPIDDPWWGTHTPMNGWGCTCKKFMVNDRDLKRLGLKVADQAPPLNEVERTVGANGPNPHTVKVPAGIDPGFDYNVGDAAWGTQLSQQATDNWAAQGAAAWQNQTKNDIKPRTIPKDPAKIGTSFSSKTGKTNALKKLFNGAEEKVYDAKGVPVLANAESTAAHISTANSIYIPSIEDALENPAEIWISFEKHKGSGKVIMRQRIVKSLTLRDKPTVNMVLNVSKGFLEGIDFISPNNTKALNAKRTGTLIYDRFAK